MTQRDKSGTGAMAQADGANARDDFDRDDAPAPPVLPPRARDAAAGGSPFEVYKTGQGTIVRWCAAAGATLLAGAFAWFLSEQLAGWPESIRLTIPVVVLVALTFWIFRLIGQKHGVVEFLIATEGEMKKVNWSTRREVIGATKVVIVTLLAMGFMLFIVNILLMTFFELIGVLKTDMLSQLFSRSGA